MSLPKVNAARKAIPLYTFLTQYFPNALIEVTKVAVAGNVQNCPGEPLHWKPGVSMDQLNTAMRHIFDHGMGHVYDDEPPEVIAAINSEEGDQHPTMHLAKAAWRLLAEIELLCEARSLGIDVNVLTRGTHESRGLVEEPKYPDPSDYSTVARALDSVSDDPIWRAAELAHDPKADLAPVGTGQNAPNMPNEQLLPIEKQWPDNAGAGAPHTPKGRLLACGCFGNCAGLTPNCPNHPQARRLAVAGRGPNGGPFPDLG